MTCSCLWVLVNLRVSEVVAVLPWRSDWIEGVQIVKAKSVRPTSSKEKEFVADVAQLHSCSGCWAFTDDHDLRPQEFLEAKNEKIIESLRAVPTTEYVEVVLDNARTVIGSWRWPHTTYVLYVSPVEGRGIQLVQIVQIISAISSTEHVNFVLVAVGGVHVARAWWLAREFVVEPFELLQI